MSDQLFDLSGKVAIVTGTSRGLGQYFGRALARAGADLVITSRTLDTLAEFKKEVESLGHRVVPVELDVRNYDSIQRMATRAKAAFGIHYVGEANGDEPGGDGLLRRRASADDRFPRHELGLARCAP